MEFHMINITYAELHMRAETGKMTFSCTGHIPLCGIFILIGNILMAVDPPGQTSKMAYLHQKRLNFIQEGQNERRYSLAGIKKAHLQWKIPKEAGAEL